MAEIKKKGVDVKKSEIISTVEETCFVTITEDEIKLENTETKGNLKKQKRILQLILFFRFPSI